MSKLTFTESSILYQMRDENLLFEPYGPDTIRVRATRNGTFSDEKWTLLFPLPAACTVEGDEHHASMTFGSLKVEVWKGWQRVHYRFLRDGKEILVAREDGDPVTKDAHQAGNMYDVRMLFDAKEGESFVPKYNQLLRSCGSGTIAEVAASVGIDVRDPAFWRASLEVVKNDIDTFCKLCEK